MDFFTRTKQHLKASNMSYIEHLDHSIVQSNRLILIAVKSYIHGVLPWFFASSGPLGIYKIYKEIKKIHHVQKIFGDFDRSVKGPGS